jgi:hypothetical protein
MVAYSFQTGFLRPIRAGEKQQPIRLPRKRHARAGEELQFFTGPRMKPHRVGGATCRAVHQVRLDFAAHQVQLDDTVTIDDPDDLDAFAIRDGFQLPSRVGGRAWLNMARWWAITHPGQPVFQGVMIDWGETFEPTPTPTIQEQTNG